MYRDIVGKEVVWSAGNVAVARTGDDARRDNGKPNLRMTITQAVGSKSTASATTPPLLPAEAVLASDVLRAAAVDAGGSACGGQTLQEVIWEEMDAIMERLMTGQAAEHDVGLAQGVAYCLAVMQNPYLPNVDSVREQAMSRWEKAEQEAPVLKQAATPAERRSARRRRKA